MSDKLNELFEVCTINNFLFIYQKEGDHNYIDYELESNKITVNIVDSEDTGLNQLLNDKIEELKKLFY